MSKKSQTMEDVMFRNLQVKLGGFTEKEVKGETTLVRTPLSMVKLKDLAESKGMEVTKDTTKSDYIAFFK